MIVQARGDRPTLERLLRQYWAPVYAVVRRQGYGPHDASDLTQEFLTTVVLSRDLLGKADPQRGRFRSFLRRALKNFLIDRHRSAVRRTAGHTELTGGTPGDDGSGHEHGLAGFGDDAPTDLDRLFDRRWAGAIVERAMAELEDGLRADGMLTHWQAFEINVASPALRGTKPIALDKLGERLGVADPDVLSNMLQTARRRFRKILRDIVAETVSAPGEVDDELGELRRLIDGRGEGKQKR